MEKIRNLVFNLLSDVYKEEKFYSSQYPNVEVGLNLLFNELNIPIEYFEFEILEQHHEIANKEGFPFISNRVFIHPLNIELKIHLIHRRKWEFYLHSFKKKK